MSNDKIDQWQRDLDKVHTRDAKFITASGEPVELLTTPDTIKETNYDEDISSGLNYFILEVYLRT